MIWISPGIESYNGLPPSTRQAITNIYDTFCLYLSINDKMYETIRRMASLNSNTHFDSYCWRKNIALPPYHPWWRHQMETFYALLAFCAGNSPVTGEFPAQRLMTRNSDFMCAWNNNWENNGDIGDLRQHRANSNGIVMSPQHWLCTISRSTFSTKNYFTYCGEMMENTKIVYMSWE